MCCKSAADLLTYSYSIINLAIDQLLIGLPDNVRVSPSLKFRSFSCFSFPYWPNFGSHIFFLPHAVVQGLFSGPKSWPCLPGRWGVNPFLIDPLYLYFCIISDRTTDKKGLRTAHGLPPGLFSGKKINMDNEEYSDMIPYWLCNKESQTHAAIVEHLH